MGNLTLILGGARSGKSTYAEQQAAAIGGESVLYVATSRIRDDEMQQRVDKHRAVRPAGWRTLEAPEQVGVRIREDIGEARLVLVDCLTFLVANTLLDTAGPEDDAFDAPSSDPFDPAIEQAVITEIEDLIACCRELDLHMILVSNEVGMGVVPPYELGRAYRDMLGRANQVAARHADEVLLLVAGLPMKVK